MELRTSDNHCITSTEELQEKLETCLDRWSASELVNTILEYEDTPEFNEENCLNYLCENCDYSDSIGELNLLADEISDGLIKIGTPEALEILKKVKDLNEKLYNTVILY